MNRDSIGTRRQYLSGAAAGTLTAVAGCLSFLEDGGNNVSDGPAPIDSKPLKAFRGSGAIIEDRQAPGGTSYEDMPNLSGTLNLYLGGGEGGRYTRLIELFKDIYPEFDVKPSHAPSSQLANQIVTEVDNGQAEADVFWSIDSASLGFVTDNDAYESLSDTAVGSVPSSFTGTNNAWTGIAGRARSIPYNTNKLSESDIPNNVRDIPGSALEGSMGWAPTYGAFKSFVTAMRLIRGDQATKDWLVSMKDGTKRFENEDIVSKRVADGAIDAGFANHYYAMRVINRRDDAPIDLAFTEGDAGALVDVSGTLKVKGTEKGELVDNFVRHLHSMEAQEFFATKSYSYPMIPEVKPVGGLPTVDELNPPDIDLAKLSNVDATLDLMREANVL